MLIGLTGPAFSGKDTVGWFLTLQHGFTAKAFADPLRDGLRKMLGLLESDFLPDNKERTIDWLGKSPRELLQSLGTEWGRDLVHRQVWVRRMAMRIQDDLHADKLIVITDVRFVDEAELIHRFGGHIWQILRPGSETTEHSDHRSEQELVRIVPDTVILNDGTIKQLGEKVDDAVHFTKTYHPVRI